MLTNNYFYTNILNDEYIYVKEYLDETCENKSKIVKCIYNMLISNNIINTHEYSCYCKNFNNNDE